MTMATAAFDRFTCEDTDVRGIAKDAVRQAGHIAHEVRAFKTMAVDAVEDRVAETAQRIRKEPFKFVGFAFAVGVPFGAFLGWALRSVVKPPRPAA
jgi:ElaB/YqjD/DUF883 family membrane-anchored ribosome-binding protein